MDGVPSQLFAGSRCLTEECYRNSNSISNSNRLKFRRWIAFWGRVVQTSIKETRLPRLARSGASGVYDYEYERNGVSNLFMLFAPLEGWRRVEVTDRRTKADWARVVKQLVDVEYAHKDRIVLVMDNLNTHHPASLYEAFEPAEARRIAERLEVHFTPKHGSWLNMAEIEIGVMARQCLDRRISDQSALRREIEVWQDRRNRDTIRVNWRFTTADARIKLKSLYPSIQHLRTTKLKPRWDVHLSGDDDQLGCASESLSSVLGERSVSVVRPPPSAHFTLALV